MVSVTSTGAQSSGIGTYGPGSIGTGLSILTPAGVKTVTGGFNEAQDYLKSIGGGVIEITTAITAAGQFVFRNSVSVRGNNFLITSTSGAPTPFITDTDTSIQSKADLLGMQLSVGTACTDTVVLARGSAGTSNVYQNTTAFFQIVAIIGGTVSNIALSAVAPFYGATATLPNTYAIVALAPGQTVTTTYTANASPQITVLSGVMTFGPAVGNNYDVGLQTANVATTNGYLGCGWVAPSGTDLGNCAANHFLNLTMGVAGTPSAGLYGFRALGAGGGNNDAFVNNLIDLIQIRGFGQSQATASYGMAFSAHTDSNTVQVFFGYGSVNSPAGSACVIFNDGTFTLPATQTGVNDNVVHYLLTQAGATNIASQYVVISNNAGSVASGTNRVLHMAHPGTMTTPVLLQNGAIFDGSDQVTLMDWRYGQPNFLGVAATIYATGGGSNAVVNATTTLNAAGLATAGGTGAGASAQSVITPHLTGIVRFSGCVKLVNGTVADGWKIQPIQGVGTPPITNATTGIGTSVGQVMTVGTTPIGLYIFFDVVVSGLTVGTAAWLDLAFATITGGSLTLSNIQFTLQELAA